MEKKVRQNILKYKLLSDNALPPTKATSESAGFDLYVSKQCKILPGETAVINTDVAVICPDGSYGKLADRSSISSKYNLHVIAGVIDRDYIGQIRVVMHNFGKETMCIPLHMKIAQIIFHKIIDIDEVIELKGELESTERGTNGFGSSN